MLFDSPIYIAFLLTIVGVYWTLRHRAQNVLLLGCSYFFYGWWDWRFLLLMIASTIMDFLIAKRLRPGSPFRRQLLLTSIVANLAVLGFFKYFDFFVESTSRALDAVGIYMPTLILYIVLPPGISFYTFQEIAYIIDVYEQRLEPCEDFVDYALFISLFPHLIAGPIQRPSHLVPQVQLPRVWDERRVFDGAMLIVTGLFRKCVIADNCALLANAAFDGRLGEPSLFVVLLGAYAFAWQIYGDFSGYSDIARGSAQLLGFHFMVNFRQPYLAHSLQDFWRRWHISLSTWLRDYLYIRLGGNAYGDARTYRNLLLTMLLGGLWHGANWTFVVWGGLHGTWLAIERFVRKPGSTGERQRSGVWARRILVFQIVCLSWVFFRAQSLTEARALLSGLGHVVWNPMYVSAFLVLAVFALPLFFVDLWLERTGEEYPLQMSSPAIRVAAALGVFAILGLFSGVNLNAFIYFQF